MKLNDGFVKNDSLYGSAKFSDWMGYTKKEAWDGYGIVLGANKDGLNRYYSYKPTRHFITIANTRDGKGSTQIIPNLLHYWGSCLVIDPKGENAYLTAAVRRIMGQKIHILDPWGEVNRRYGSKTNFLEEVATFNPLSLLDLESNEYVDDLAYIADSFIINEGGDPHWDNSARELVAGLISFAVEKYGEKANFNILRKLITLPQEEIAKIAVQAQEFGFESIAAAKLSRFQSPQNKELSSVISTAVTQTAILDNPALTKNMLESSFSFDELTLEKGATIYIVLPTDKLRTYGRWLRLMISLGIRTISRNTKKLEHPVLFVLDEFGTIGKLSAVSQAMGLMAGLQMCLWVFLQDLNQLKRDYPEDWETFLGNTEAISVLGAMDNTTTKYFSEMLGVSTIEQMTTATDKIRQYHNIWGFADNKNYLGKNDRTMQRILLTPQEIRMLGIDLGFLISREEVLITKKIHYYENEDFFSRAREDPYYESFKNNIKFEKEEYFINKTHLQIVLTSLVLVSSISLSLLYYFEKVPLLLLVAAVFVYVFIYCYQTDLIIKYGGGIFKRLCQFSTLGLSALFTITVIGFTIHLFYPPFFTGIVEIFTRIMESNFTARGLLERFRF